MRNVITAILMFFCCVYLLHAQEAVMENNLAINYALNSWKFNTSFGHRAIREKVGESSNNKLAFMEFNQFVTRKINPDLTISIGYKYRDINNDSEEIEHRLTQQVALIHYNNHIRLVSRLRLEQRFRDQFIHRYRYRFSMDMPLSGLKLDSKECYLVASNEIVVQRSSSSNRVDNRFSAGVGYVFSALAKLQLDFTHRVESINKKAEQIPFLTTSLIFNIN